MEDAQPVPLPNPERPSVSSAYKVQVAYKKLLNGKPTFADLKDAQPNLAKGLQALLDYSGADIADVFCRTFEVEYRVLDQVCHLSPLAARATHFGVPSCCICWISSPTNRPDKPVIVGVRSWNAQQRYLPFL